MPCETVAGGDSLYASIAVIDSEVESGDTIASLSVGGGNGVNSRGCVYGSVPHIAVASCDGHRAGGTVVDGKVEGHRTIATDNILSRISGNLSTCSVTVSVPDKAVACRDGLGGSSALIKGQVKGVDIGTS